MDIEYMGTFFSLSVRRLSIEALLLLLRNECYSFWLREYESTIFPVNILILIVHK